MAKGWHGDRQAHSMASKGVKTKCDVPDPMKTRSNKQLLYGHSITHSRKYQESVGVKSAKCEHDRLVTIMEKRGMKHKSPFKSKVR